MKSLDEIAAYIKASVAQGKDLKGVLSILVKILDAHKHDKLNDAIIASARYQALKFNILSNLIGYEQGNIETNKIRLFILELCDELTGISTGTDKEQIELKEIFENNYAANVKQNENQVSFRYWLVRDLILVAIIGGFIFIYFLIIFLRFPLVWNHGVQALFCAFVLLKLWKYKKVLSESETSINKELEIVDMRDLKLSEFDILEKENYSKANEGFQGLKRKMWDGFKKRVNEVYEQFFGNWYRLWLCFFFFYALNVLKSVSYFNHQEVLIELFQNFITTIFCLFFVIFYTNTYSNFNRNRFNYITLGVLFSVVAFTIVTNFDFSKLFNNEGIGTQIKFWCRMIVGITTGITMSLFTGRLVNTKFIHISWIIAVCFFTYASVRTLYSFLFINDVFEKELSTAFVLNNVFEMLKDLMYHSSFVLKIILFLSISWLTDTGRMLYFIVEESSLFFKKDAGFKDFLNNYELTK